MEKGEGHPKQRVEKQVQPYGFLVFFFLTFPTPLARRGCPTPEPHLRQAHHAPSGFGGTEGATIVQVHEAAVTEAVRMVGAPSPVHLWGQPLSHPLSGGVGGSGEDPGIAKVPGGQEEKPEVACPKSHPHCRRPSPLLQQHSEERGRERGRGWSRERKSGDLAFSLCFSFPRGPPFCGSQRVACARGANAPRSHF